jgi:NTE family protein
MRCRKEANSLPKEIKTALVLGGGGARGAYEIGVWQALREMDIPIDIVTGTSVGAINGAMIVQDAFEEAVTLWKKIETHMVFDGGPHKKATGPLKSLMEKYIDETAIRNSKVDYGLVTIELPSLTQRLLFKEDIPKGKLIDFILASAALFPAFKMHDIDNVKYVDGGYLNNMPVDMALKKGATHVVAVNLDTAGIVRKEPLEEVDNLKIIHCKWDLGSILVFDSASACRNIRLGYLDTLRAYGFYDGYFYCFPRGEFNKKALATAEMVAKVFHLDPIALYTKSTFHDRLKEAVSDYRNEMQQELKDFQTQIKNRKLAKESLPNILSKINERTLIIIIADFLRAHSESHKHTID